MAADTSEQDAPSKFVFPSAYSILFALIIVIAGLTWIVPAGQYERQLSEALDKDVPIPGTYQEVEQNPQDFTDVILAPIAGFYDPESYEANAIDVSLFVLIIGGFLGVVTKTGAINAGITSAMKALRGREKWMIPILMGLFAAGGTTYGMAEETLAFYPLIIPVMIAAGYDATVAVAVILLGAGIGVLGSTINPFATVIASDAAGVPFTNGIYLRLFILIASWLACVTFVMRYAARVKSDAKRSIVADMKEENEARFLGLHSVADVSEFTERQKIILIVFGLTFAVMIYGVSIAGWWMAEMSALFLAASILIGLVGWMRETTFIDNFVDGARELLGVALIIGIARGIVVVMDNGRITDTILHEAELAIQGLPEVVFVNAMFFFEGGLSFLVPSSSGLAVLSMPILAPLSEFAGVTRDLAVTAYQSASGVVNLITPTSGVVMGALGIARLPYDRWLRFTAPLILILIILIVAALSFGVLTQAP